MKHLSYLLLLPILFLQSCIDVTVELPGGINQGETNEYISFSPEDGATTGFIYYPGAFVAATSYNAWMEDLAREGYLAVTARIPFNLAILDVGAARRIQNKFPEIENWVIGGHSLGGAMACQLVSEELNSGRFDGLVLTGSYPSTDLSGWSGKVLSLYGTKDGVSTPDEILGSLDLLPPYSEAETVTDLAPGYSTYLHAIEGGNHAQFGNYGLQQGDGVATISPEAQQEEMVEFISAFFSANGW